MVAQTQSGDPSTVPWLDRGIVIEETAVVSGAGRAPVLVYPRPFWRPIIGGALFVYTLFILSWYLMLGFHVGIATDGSLDLGGGAAVWLCVTAFIAYYFGGFIANLTGPTGSITTRAASLSLAKGLVLWGLSIPLGLLIYSFMANSAVLMLGLDLPHMAVPNDTAAGTAATVVATIPTGFFWALFIGLGLGLIASIMGSASACTAKKEQVV